MDTLTLKKLVLLLATLFFVLACELPLLSTPAPPPAPGALDTIVAATAGAAQTQTARVVPSPTVTPTLTPKPTSSPTDTPTATATVIFDIPTATLPFVTKSAGSNCQITAQSPVDNTRFDPGEAFTMEWGLRNTGSATWLSNNNDFFHSGGTDMHSRDALDLPRNVGPSGEVTFSVQMAAPGSAGSYTSNWTLGKKKETLCKVSITIVVK